MARILVLEDEEQSRNALVKILQGVSSDIIVDAAADLAKARLLLKSSVSFDLFFLDINLNPGNSGDQSGIRFAEEIRAIQNYEFTPVVMVTSVAGMEMESYRRLHCYQYLIKPYEQSEVQAVAARVLAHMEHRERQFIVVKKDGINYRIPCEDIVFCKAVPRGVCLYLKEDRIEVPYLTIRRLMEKLPDHLFFQCHRMYVVNRNMVRYYDLVNQIIQMEGYSDINIDIGVTFKTEVRRMMYE